MSDGVPDGCKDISVLSFASKCIDHIDCCMKVGTESRYELLQNKCGFGTTADFEYATKCCADTVMKAIGRANLTDLCYDPQHGTEACDFAEPSICCPGGSGVLLPFADETEWAVGLRSIIYLIFVGWLFIGIAIISDIFMAAIEEITAAKKESTIEIDGKTRRAFVPVWNFTVANLSLMALGSSAPEILLSVLELVGKRFHSGRLGASTIVGSAAFNLFSITAVCISAIPAGEVRYIDRVDVYSVTLTFSLFAYLWIYICLAVESPDIITTWEALLTLAFFPMLLLAAYLADIEVLFAWCQRTTARVHSEIDISTGAYCSEQTDSSTANMPVVPQGILGSTPRLSDGTFESKRHISQIMKNCKDLYGGQAEEKTVQRFIRHQTRQEGHKSRAYYRVLATRQITGGRRIAGEVIGDGVRSANFRKTLGEMMSQPIADPDMQEVEFSAPHYSCLESQGIIEIHVVRAGPTFAPLTVHWKTRNGTAVAGEDFVEGEGDVIFETGEEQNTIKIELIDDDANEPDEDFFIDLSEPTSTGKCRLGEVKTAVVTIIDDDEPGVISFLEDDFYVKEDEKIAYVWAMRKDGCSADVKCKYCCVSATAKAAKDFESVEGELIFKKGEIRKCIEVPVIDNIAYDKDAYFNVILTEPQGGSTFCALTDGGEDKCVTRVHIKTSEESKRKIDLLSKMMASTPGVISLGNGSWQDQFKDAFSVHGEEEDGEDAPPPSTGDYVMHMLSLPFKVLFALTPPAVIGGGWPAFVISLGFIGGLTAVVGDAASMVGCVIGIPDEITAITFVALGTSLPDTFASKTAAQEEPFADASVGNVTGSNSVNVFLGLGLAWALGAFYWEGEGATDEWLNKYKRVELEDGLLIDVYEGGAFHVASGTLGFSVLIYTILACFSTVLLIIRRKKVGGELGGSKFEQVVSSSVFFGIWIIYVLANIIYVSTVNE